jgi:hypothetical protein
MRIFVRDVTRTEAQGQFDLVILMAGCTMSVRRAVKYQAPVQRIEAGWL